MSSINLIMIDKENHKELFGILYDTETQETTKPIITEFGKSFNIDEDVVDGLLFEALNFKGYNGKFIIDNNALEVFKSNNVIEILYQNIEIPKYSLQEKSINLHPLVKENLYFYKTSMIMNNKNIKFLIENGFTIPREDKFTGFNFGNKVFYDLTNLKQNEFYFYISENKIGLDSKPRFEIDKNSFLFKNNLLYPELLSNLMNYIEKEFNFTFTEDHYKYLNNIVRKELGENGLTKYTILNGLDDYSNISGYTYGSKTIEQNKYNKYMENIIGKSLDEVFRKIHKNDLDEILKGNFEIFNKDKSYEIKLIDIVTPYDNNVINILKERGYVIYRKEFEDEKYIVLKEDRNSSTGNLEKSIYVNNSLDKVNMNILFVETNELLDILKPNVEIKKEEIIENNDDTNNTINEKIESNKLTLDDFVQKHKIDLNSDLGKDLLKIFEEKQKGLFEKLVDKTKDIIGIERER